MDIDDDYQSSSPPKKLSPQVQFRRLKRSKRSGNKSPKDLLLDSSDDPLLKDPLFNSSEDPLLFSHVDFDKLEALENGSEPQIFDESNSTEEVNVSQDSLSQEVENETENGNKTESGFDAEVKRTKRVLEFSDDVVVGSEESGSVIREETNDFEPEKKKERIGDEDPLEQNEEKKKNKKRKEKSDGGDESKNSRGPNKRREDKERKAYLKELHAESQRLLRETGDASFKPIPVVHKPISSILEKIRKRKLEISKKFMTANGSNHDNERNIRPRDRLMDLDNSNGETLEDKVAMTVEKEVIAPSMEGQSSLAASKVDEDAAELAIHENDQNQVPENEEPTPAFRAPVDDTQDLFGDSEPIGAATVLDDEKPNSPLDEDFDPSLHAMDLKLDSGPVNDSSSEEEDNDKENFDPHPRGVADNSSPSPNGDPVKNFIDEEAEEEDDSDNDLNRFQENEDEDIDDFEDLKDMIATEYEERPADKETRNELHQKWLEQQDASGTENLIQRLKCGSVLRDTFLSDDEPEADEDDENDEEIDDEADEDSLPKESGRINIKKAKQIIHQLYTGKEDTYLSDGDDDDDMQRRRAQYLIRKEERGTKALPVDDASSREVFGLIKKLNIATDYKRKPKASSIFDSVLKGGNNGQSSKSSFLGRVSNHHIPSSHKQGSATFRSFIFGRDDSSSRSSMSVSEGSSVPVPQEIRPTKNLTTCKYSNSQGKARNQTTDGAVEAISSTSLLEILKRSSSESKIESAVDLTKGIFAFRAPKKPTKIEGRS